MSEWCQNDVGIMSESKSVIHGSVAFQLHPAQFLCLDQLSRHIQSYSLRHSPQHFAARHGGFHKWGDHISSSILDWGVHGFSTINRPSWGHPHLWKPQNVFWCCLKFFGVSESSPNFSNAIQMSKAQAQPMQGLRSLAERHFKRRNVYIYMCVCVYIYKII